MSDSRSGLLHRPTGHVFRVDGKRGAVWYAKYRLPSGRQVQRRLGPAAPERGRPPAGHFTRRLAEDWLEHARGGAPGDASGDGRDGGDVR